MVNSSTSTGIEVTMTGEEYAGSPTVLVEFSHPKLGRVSFRSAEFGERQGQHGIIGYHGRTNQRVCVTVPRADFDAAMSEARAVGEREVEAMKSGAVKIRVRYRDGEYLSGYAANCARAADLLAELGLAESVSGWGTLVSDEVVKALGEEFTYQQAVEFSRPARERVTAAKEKADQDRAEKFAEARRTRRPVELQSWSEDCCERDFDCSTDVVTEYALPDGSTKRDRVHTH